MVGPLARVPECLAVHLTPAPAAVRPSRPVWGEGDGAVPVLTSPSLLGQVLSLSQPQTHPRNRWDGGSLFPDPQGRVHTVFVQS